MKIIRITDSIISDAVNRLNRVSGGESDITIGRDADRDTLLNQI